MVRTRLGSCEYTHLSDSSFPLSLPFSLCLKLAEANKLRVILNSCFCFYITIARITAMYHAPILRPVKQNLLLDVNPQKHNEFSLYVSSVFLSLEWLVP